MDEPNDVFTKTVIKSCLESIAEEMLAVLKQTAMSPIIYEVLDVGTGVVDSEGNLISSGAGIPTFVGVLDKAVKQIINIHKSEDICEGDVFITNDPYYGGVTHLNDVVITVPVFFQDRRIAWTATIAHWNDVGGMTKGSMSVKAEEIFQEGLRLPAVKLFSQGEKISSVFDIILANSRLPDFVSGDLWAQIAACRRAESRITGLARNYGLMIFQQAVADSFNEGKERSLRGLKNLPRGEFSLRETQDDGSEWQVKIVVRESSFIVDLSENPPQTSSPYNISRDAAVIAAQIVFKSLTDPELFANAGSFSVLEVITKPGTIFHSLESAPQGFYFETRIRLLDMLCQTIAKTIPDKLPAGHFASIYGTVISGVHPDTRRSYTMVEPQMGGWGGSSRGDGLSAMYSACHGETYNCPAEICEARYGIDVVWKALSESEQGMGFHRGGKGLSICYRPKNSIMLSAGISHNRVPVWGLEGGEEGGRNRLYVIRKSGEKEEYGFISDLLVSSDDTIHIETANGGGWGRK